MADEDTPSSNGEDREQPSEDVPSQPEAVKEKQSKPGNIWKPLAIVMTVLFIVAAGAYIIMPPTGAAIGAPVTAEEAGNLAVKYIEDNLVSSDVSVEVTSVEKIGNFYQISIELSAEGYSQEVASFMSLDGRYFFPSGYDMTETTIVTTSTIEEIPQTDVPKVELFIWSYCPYGVTAQGPLAEVASLLGDYADFEAVLYYAGHGDYEEQQNKIQACIQKLEADKYWEYAAGFVENIYPKCSGDIDCDKTESVALMNSLGIDSGAVLECVDSEGVDLLDEHYARAQEYGVTGSPTLVINGVVANVARTAEAYKTAVCSAFNDTPAECDEVLSGNASAASGSC